MEITATKSMPKKILVLIIANMSSPFETFTANIWVIMKSIPKKSSILSTEKYPTKDVIMKNQNVSPAVTVIDLNRDEDAFMLDRIDECD